MKLPRIELYLLSTIMLLGITPGTQAATVFYDHTATITNPVSTYTGFGLLGNQELSAASFVWELYFDDLTYTTETGAESQTFDSAASASAAGWQEYNSRVPGNNFGFSNSNNAGGASAGEAGGLIDRNAPRGYYADTSIGTVDMATDDLFASGTMVFDASAANSSLFLGWINPAQPTNTNRLGFILTEPNAAAGPQGARIAIVMSGAGGTQTEGQLAISNIADVQLYWELHYSATTGQLRGLIQEIPEPSSLGLCSIGGLLMLRRRGQM